MTSRDDGYCVNLNIVNPLGDLHYGFRWFRGPKSLNIEDESLSLFLRNLNHIAVLHTTPYRGYLNQHESR
ncbi:MAG: hypothetical protein ACTSPR_07660, partial [Candidatus Thorarchaeota archaeon]